MATLNLTAEQIAFIQNAVWMQYESFANELRYECIDGSDAEHRAEIQGLMEQANEISQVLELAHADAKQSIA